MKRLRHRIKVDVGSAIERVLKNLDRHGIGPKSRVQSAAGETNVRLTLAHHPLEVCLEAPCLTLNSHDISNSYLTRYPKRYVTSPCGVLTLNNAKITMPISLHFWNGHVFREAVISESLLLNPKYAMDLERVRFWRSKPLPEGILLSLPWNYNYYHWLVDIIPRLQLVEGFECPLYVPREIPNYCMRILDELKLGRRISFLENGVYNVSKLHIPTRFSSVFNVSPLAINWLRETFLTPDGVSPRRLLYISRSNARIRYLENEIEVVTMLKGLGFETVSLDRLSTFEQAKLFNEAKLIVGCHGAAFANIVFASRGATLIELFERGHFAHCYHAIANQVGMQYGFLVGIRKGLGFTIDVAALKTLVSIALKGLSHKS